MEYSKRERVNAVLRGNLADRPPITAYRHFPKVERNPEDLSNAMLQWQTKYDWDILKIHPAATYMQEVWGDEYDYKNYYDEIFPTKVKGITENNLNIFNKKNSDTPVFRDMIKAIKLIKKNLKEDVPILQTIFTPMTTIATTFNCPFVRRHFPAERKDNKMFDIMTNREDDLLQALDNITETYISYWRAMREAGIDGLFYAGVSWARQDYLTYEEWGKFIAQFDKKFLNVVQKDGGICMYHTCGINSNPQRFADYPIDILHWDQGGNNPSIKESVEFLKDITPMGGVDEMIFGTNSASEIKRLTEKIVLENKDIPFILAPYCSVSIHSTEDELRAFRNAADYLLKNKL